MRVVQVGEGDPEVAVVGGIHGDEPCGARAVERLVEDDLAVERPVLLVVANEEALAAGRRFLDADLNRAFADDVPGDAHEYGLARELTELLGGCLVLSLHSTRSTDRPFAIVNRSMDRASAVCPALSVAALVRIDADEGRLVALDADLVEVEAGLQGTEEAAENAYRIAREFLTAAGALPGPTLERELPVFRLGEAIEKPPAGPYRVLVENFELVEAGEAFAEAAGEPLVADEPFYPVLLSADGYADVFGYRAEQLETLAAPGRESPR